MQFLSACEVYADYAWALSVGGPSRLTKIARFVLICSAFHAVRNREEVLNVRLSDVLRSHGADSAPETIQRRGRERPDVTLGLFRGMRVVIEGKLADEPQARKKVQADAQGRIDSGIAQLAVAVVYPAVLREQADSGLVAELQKANLDFAVLSETSPGCWRSGTAADILNELRRANEGICRQDVVQEAAKKISRYLDGVAAILENDAATCDRLSQLLGFSLAERTSEKLDLKRRRTAAKVAALTLANAFIFQEQLSSTQAQVHPLRQTLPRTDFVDTTIGHWDWICKAINYVPIFKVAIEILRAIPGASASSGAIHELARAALEVAQNKAALRHDLMGRIYHLLLHEAKFLGTYYTSVPAATLLMKLALDPARWPDRDFSDAKSLTEFLLADLTCGTGTLLIGACQAIADNYVLARAGRKKLDD